MSDDLSAGGYLKAIQNCVGVYRPPVAREDSDSMNRLEEILGQLIMNVDPSKIQAESTSDIHKLSIALASLQRTQIESEKWRAEREDRRQELLVEFQTQIREDLYAYPQIQAQLRQIAEKAAKTVADKPRAGRPKKHSKREQ